VLTGHATVLLVDDVARALDYYGEQLGFEVEPWAENPQHYGYAKRDNAWLHFAHFHGAHPRPNHGAARPDMFDAYFWVDDVDALHAELLQRGAEVVQEPVDQPWCREIRVLDPHGYVLAFGQPYR